jgi:DNA-binding MarR family transcriptional regulator
MEKNRAEGGLYRICDPCAALRRASRAMTHLYDLVLSPTGIKSTQFIILRAIREAGELPQWRFADEYGISDDTLSRRLAILRKLGMVEHRIGSKPAGERLYRLTPLGQRKYEEALPYWTRAEERLRHVIGDDGLEQLISTADKAAANAMAAESAKHSNVAPKNGSAAAAVASGDGQNAGAHNLSL